MPAFIPVTVEVQEDGTPKGQVNTLNFTGDITVTVTGDTADVNATTGAGSPLLPTSGTGTATGNVTGDLGANSLTLTANSQSIISIPSSLSQLFTATDGTAFSQVQIQGDAGDPAVRVNINSNNGAGNSASISVNGNDSSITHTADTHIFNGVTVGNILTDGTATANISASAQTTGDVYFQMEAQETGQNPVRINGNGITSTITHTADQHTINGLVDIAGATDIVGNSTITGTLTMTGAVKTSANNTDDIGDSTNSFKDAYVRRVLLDGSTSGVAEIKSDALANTMNGVTLSGTGYVGATMFSRLTGNFNMSDVNTVQPVFGTSQDVWTLQGATTYRFKGQYYLTHGATSHSVGMSFELAGGASVTGISYNVNCWVTAAGSTTASQTTTLVNVATNVAVNFAGANAQETIVFEGWLTMNAGGTVTPSITFSAAPGGAPAAVAYATWIEFTPIGTNTVTTLGNVA